MAWVSLENFMRSGISQSQKDKCYMIPLYNIPEVIKLTEAKSRIVVARDWGISDKGTDIVPATGINFQFYKMNKSQRSALPHYTYS